MNFNQTFSVSFRLNRKKQKKDGSIPIYVRIKVGDEDRAECSIKRAILPEHWTDQEANDTCPDAEVLNKYLGLVRNRLNQHYNMLLSFQAEVTATQVKESYQGIGKKEKKRKPFLELFNKYLSVLKERVNAKDLSEGRYKRFGVLYRKCAAFIKHKYKKSEIPLEDIKLNFIVGFQHYMRTVNKIDNNTSMKYAKDLKQVMDYMVVEEDLTGNIFRTFKCSFQKAKPRYLDEGELEKIYSKELSIKRLSEVRDCFIFCCYTGYCYSDAEALGPDDVAKDIEGDIWIIRNRGKTGVEENVPLLQIPLDLIKKYKDHPYCVANGKLLPFNSNQKYNAYLKEIADLCGIKKRLTTHVARHTCATTVLLTNEVPIETVQYLLGHNDIRTTQIYARIVPKRVSQDMMRLRHKIDKRENEKIVVVQPVS